MRRVVVIVGMLVLAAATIAGLGFFALMKTAPGHRILASLVEPHLGAALGGDARIGSLAGELPGRIRLRNVEFTDGAASWMTINEIAIDWRPFALLRDKIEIDRLAITGAAVHAPPPARNETAREKSFQLPSLPRDLPFVTIRDLSLNAVTIDAKVAGRPLALDGAGNLRIGGRAVAVHFSATSDSDSDTANLVIEIDPRSNHGVVDVLITSERGGAVSTIAGLDGRAYLEIEANAPLTQFDAAVSGAFGVYGAIEARLEGDLGSAEGMAVHATIHPGSKLSGVASELGADISLSTTVRDDGRRTTISVQSLATRAGRLSGDIAWARNGADRNPSEATAKLFIDFAGGYKPAFVEWIGANAAINVTAHLTRGRYEIEGALTSSQAALSVGRGILGADRTFSGPVSLRLVPPASAPKALDELVILTADLSAGGSAGAALKDMEILLGGGSTAVGEVSYDWTSKKIAAAIDATFSPSMVQRINQDFSVNEPIRANISIEGLLSEFSATITAVSPPFNYRGGVIASTRTKVAATALPRTFSGELMAQGANDAGALAARFSRDHHGRLSIPAFDFTGRSFALTGSGSYEPAGDIATINARYQGEGAAEPWPGVPITGVVEVEGAISRRDRQNNLKVAARDIVSRDLRIRELEAALTGPSRAIQVRANANGVELPRIGLADDLKIEGVANLNNETSLRLTRLEAVINELPVGLTAPVTLRFDDGVAIEQLSARLGDEGSIKFDGVLSANRWRVRTSAVNAPFRGSNSFASFDLDLDTDREILARGSLVAKSVFAAESDLSIGSAFSWNGRQLKIVNSGDADAIAFDIEIPLALRRSPDLSLCLEGSLSGTFQYAGPLEALAPYLPLSLQGIEGGVEAEAVLSGTLDQPIVNGRASVRDAAYTELTSGLSLAGVHAEASASSANGETRIDFEAGARGPNQDSETITMTGVVALADTTTIDAALNMNGAALSAGPVDFAITTGTATLTGPIGAMRGKGVIQFSEVNAEITPPPTGGLVDIAVVRQDGADDETPSKEQLHAAPPIEFDVALKADERIFIRGRGLETEWSADIGAKGDTVNPVLTGALRLRRGFLDFSGRRFTLTRGQIAFDRLSPNNPVLDIRAEHKTSDGLTAAIEISGRARAPTVSLVSTPPLASDEIMALVLFGKPSNELSALESLQVAQALAQLGGIGPFGGAGVTGAARRALGLDLLNIDLDADTGASSLEVGKYVADGLFVSASQDARGEAGTVRVEYELSKSITIETELKQDGDQTVSANWKRDF